MQRLFLSVVGALGLGLVMSGATQADNKKPAKGKPETSKHHGKPASVDPGKSTTPAANVGLKAVLGMQLSKSGASTLNSGGTASSGGTSTALAMKNQGNPLKKVTDITTAAKNKSAAKKAVTAAQAAADAAAAKSKAAQLAADAATQKVADATAALPAAANQVLAANFEYAKNPNPQTLAAKVQAQAAVDKLNTAYNQAVANSSQTKIDLNNAKTAEATASANLGTAKATEVKADADLKSAILGAVLPGAGSGAGGAGGSGAPSGVGGAPASASMSPALAKKTIAGSGQKGMVIVANPAPAITAPVEPVAPAVAASGAAAGTDPAKAVADAMPQEQRYLQIQNDSGKPLTIWVQYYTKTNQGNWAWFPVDPAVSSTGDSYDIAAGQTTFLEHEGAKLSASRIRLWVKSDAAGAWAQYKDQDAWLVPELDKQGKHAYAAKEMEVFPLRLSR
jgi:hypothetical protein